MSSCLSLLILAISVTKVFGECKVCGSKGTADRAATFCKNICAPDANDCESVQGEAPCIWDKRKPANKRCVKKADTSKLCYFQDLESDSMNGNECSHVAQCAKSKKHCQQCTPCTDDNHDTKATTECYLARKGSSTYCVHNYLEDGEIKVDHCMKPDEFVGVCVPGAPGIDMEYIYIEFPTGVTWFEAQQVCRANDADLATIIYEADIQNALEYIGFGASPWTGLRSTDSEFAFSPVDGTECAVFHHGHSCRGCTEKELWQNGLPIKEDGSHCVRLVAGEATLANDVHCDDKLYAVLCNCEGTASGPYIAPYPHSA